MLSVRELNRRIKHAVATLRATGAERITIEHLPDGGARVLETKSDEAAPVDEGARVGRLIEQRMGNA